MNTVKIGFQGLSIDDAQVLIAQIELISNSHCTGITVTSEWIEAEFEENEGLSEADVSGRDEGDYDGDNYDDYDEETEWDYLDFGGDNDLD